MWLACYDWTSMPTTCLALVFYHDSEKFSEPIFTCDGECCYDWTPMWLACYVEIGTK